MRSDDARRFVARSSVVIAERFRFKPIDVHAHESPERFMSSRIKATPNISRLMATCEYKPQSAGGNEWQERTTACRKRDCLRPTCCADAMSVDSRESCGIFRDNRRSGTHHLMALDSWTPIVGESPRVLSVKCKTLSLRNYNSSNPKQVS